MKNSKIFVNFKNLFFFVLISFILPIPSFAEELRLKSLGHSSFLIKGNGQSILLNPFKSIGCASHLDETKNLEFDFVLANSRLADEGYQKTNNLFFVDPGTYKINQINLNGITVPHDRVEGRRFGLSTVWTWEQNNFKIVHMGGAAGEIDITDQILLSRPDILFISIGGGVKSYDGKEASNIVKKLKPNIIVPVQFLKDKKLNIDCELNNEELFLKNLSDFKVKYVGKNLVLKKKNLQENTIYIFN